jgi:hypothetical protein
MHEDQKGFLEEIQSLSDSTKKRVLIIATMLIMIIVIGVWVTYFNNIVVGAPQSGATAVTTLPTGTTTSPVAIVPPAPVATPSASGPGLWQNIESGFSSILHGIAGIFSHPTNYTIQPQ